MKTELIEFMKTLKANKKNITRQQFRTIRGQAYAGDINGARKGYVYIQKIFAGTIAETEEGYEFSYNEDYLKREDAVSVSLTLPLQKEAYKATVLFPFFDGLIPEGWLLGVVSRNWKINQNDRFGLLLSVCRDCIGDVNIRNGEEK